MAKQQVRSELTRLFKKFTYDYVKNEIKGQDVYFVTLNAIDAAPQFQKGFDESIKTSFNGLTISEEIQLTKINTTNSWKTAIRNAMALIKRGASRKIEFVGEVVEVSELVGAATGLYLTKSSRPENMTFVTLNRVLNKSDIGERGISRGLRRLVWEQWKSNLPPKYDSRIKLGEGKYPTGIGQKAQFAHERDSTIGTDFLRLFSEYLADGNVQLGQQLELNINYEQNFLGIAQELQSLARVDVERKRVRDPRNDLVSEQRILRGSLGKYNKKGSEETDLTQIKKEFRNLLTKALNEAQKKQELKFLGQDTAPDFKGSESFNDAATKAAIRKLKLPLTKSGKVDKRFKSVKDFIKVEKAKRINEKYNGYKGKGSTKNSKVSKARVTATAAAVLRKTKGKTEKVNLANIIMLINKSLADTIKKNMGRPALINRTGRFADSAQVVSAKSAKQTVAVNYTYQLRPYETFENTGGREWPAGYNPKPLIAKSIREEAAKYLQTKLTLRRV